MLKILNQKGDSPSDIGYLMASLNSAATLGTEEDFLPAVEEELASTSEKQAIEIHFVLQQKKQQFLLKKITSHHDAVAWRETTIDPPTPDSPFDILDVSEQKKRKSLIEEIKELPRPYAQRLYRRIQLLDEAAEEEYPYEELISAKSLEGFLKFMKRQEPFIYPDTSITPEGNIRIQWQQDKNHHLAIEFISDTESKFVIFAPDPTHPMKVARISGKVSIDSIIASVEPFNALSWSTE